MFYWGEGLNIFDLGILGEDEYLIFLNKDTDILGNANYTEYCIHRNKNKLLLKFEKKTTTNKTCVIEFTIETIQTVKKSSLGKLVLPNFISEEDVLEGTYKEGYTFRFDEITSFKILKEGDRNNDKNKEVVWGVSW